LKTKVLIIGAGPSGAMAAYRLAAAGFHDLVLVDRSDFPRIKPCAGGISPSACKFLEKTGLDRLITGLTPRADMKRLRFIGPQGQDVTLGSNLKAVTINRKIFDAALLNEAKRAGAKFIPGFEVRELLRDAGGAITGATDGKTTIHSEVTILATGGRNKNFRDRYFADRRPLRLIYSRIGWWRGFALEKGAMEMIFDRDCIPHYGWVFPEGDGIVNIGVCLYEDKLKGKNVTDVFNEHLARYHASRLANAVQVGRSLSFVINTSQSVRHVYADRMLYVGEAGRLCNPATAEGISYAMESGWLAAEAILKAYKRGLPDTPDEKSLRGYEQSCRRAFNFRLRRASLFSKIVDSPLFNLMINIGTSKFSQRIISRLFGDM
jgi:menaquinone-9 beta-reductase